MKVLIVDDEKGILVALQELIMENFPAEVVKADNGLDGFLRAQKEKYDLIITDHKMPFMLGSAMIVAIRTKENKNKETPIIMLSGYLNDVIKSQLQLGRIEFVAKPFAEADFISLLQTFL
ncbi:MAG: response regulator [Oligoflexia bacterium]|nr:response regulator [Oligoflexia bacterium]